MTLFYFRPSDNMFYSTLGCVKFEHVKVGCVFHMLNSFLFLWSLKGWKGESESILSNFFMWYIIQVGEKKWDIVQDWKGDKLRRFPWGERCGLN